MTTRNLYLNKMFRIKIMAISRLLMALYMMMSLCFSMTYGQASTVIASLAVTPPYTSKIDVYISQPNKIMATFLNTTLQPVDVYILGSFKSEGGINVYTDPDFRMSPPLTLFPQVPYNLNRFNLEQVFDEDHLQCQGITIREVLYGNGLPEDYYTICLQAFNYGTGEPLSAESPQGCSNSFLVLDLEAPVVLSPADGTEFEPVMPQNIPFVWTRPPGSPDNTQFDIKIIEVLPSDRNINDAVKSASHPVFFETTVSITSYLLGPADPALTGGKTYACVVTAYDPSGKAVFRNNGMSEVSSFLYLAPDTIPAVTRDSLIISTGGE
jgi:TANFOR domain-containing protein